MTVEAKITYNLLRLFMCLLLSSGSIFSLVNAVSYKVSLVAGDAYGSDSPSNNLIFVSGDGSKKAYWVSPAGAASWTNAKSETPLSATACCSLATANANAIAGDTIYLRGGTYHTNIQPSNSGFESARITYRAYADETSLFVINEANGRWAVKLDGKSHISVIRISSVGSGAFFHIGYGSLYNEIADSYFEQSSGTYSLGCIENISTAGVEGPASNHNWIHGNVFTKYGWISSGEDNGTVRISNGINDPSAYNTFEDNVFSYGGHDCLDIGGRYNVVRNNIFHNEEAYFEDTSKSYRNVPPGGYFGNRNIILTNYGDGIGTAQHTLIEGNRVGYGGTPPDDDGANGIENAGFHTIVRYNFSYGNGASGYESKAQGGYYSSVRSGSRARVYNNTFYHNGHGSQNIWGLVKCGLYIDGKWDPTQYDWPQDVAIKNNIIYDSYNNDAIKFETPSVRSYGPVVLVNNLEKNPFFVAPAMTDKTSPVLPDLTLKAGSSAINGGTYLTQANGSGSGSVMLVVDDAMYFQDGTWGSSLSNVQADWIAIGTVNNVVQIKSIDYKAKVITLVESMTWNSKAPIWLFRNSRGQLVLRGAAPDIGAYEYQPSFIPQ